MSVYSLHVNTTSFEKNATPVIEKINSSIALIKNISNSIRKKDIQPMSSGAFPENPDARKIIIAMSSHDIEKCMYVPDAGKILLYDNVYILPIPLDYQRSNTPVAIQNIKDARLANAGAMLVQSPFDPDTYEEISNASYRLALTKQLLFSNFCMLLGAKKVKVEQIDVRNSKSDSNFSFNGEKLGNTADAKISLTDLDNFREMVNLHDNFSGEDGNIQEAEQFLRDNGLWGDINFRTLFNMRKNVGNKITSRELVINLSSETRSALAIAANIKIPNIFQMNVDHKKIIEERFEYSLKVTVSF